MTTGDGGAAPYTIGFLNGGRSDDPREWSGIPYSVAQALGELGARVVALDTPLPRPVEQLVNRRISVRHRVMDGVGIALSRQVRAREDLDGIVQLVSGEQFVATDLPVVTYDDMTVAQAIRIDHPATEALGPRATERWRARQERVFRQAAVCGGFSGWTVDSIVRDYGIAPDRAAVLGWGQNHHFESAAGERSWELPRFLFVGVDWRRKNGDGVVRAFAQLRERHPGARLDVVGGHPRLDVDGVEGHGLLRLDSAEQRARLRSLFAAATCFVMPSFHEPAGIVYAEAGAAGLPLIGTSEGGPSEMVRDDTGVLVDPRDDGALLAAMTRLSDPVTAAALGAGAQARAGLFTWSAVAERMLRALDAPEWLGRPWSGFLRG